MNSLIYLAVATVILIGLYGLTSRLVKMYLKYRGERIITCPETGRHAGVKVDAFQAASTAALFSEVDLRIKDCSRWPERQGCDQACLKQIETAPHGCRVRDILTEWYEGKICVFCHKPFEKIGWSEHKPALLDADCNTVEWREIKPEALLGLLPTYQPVCWNCHIAESFRREHPELVVDRHRENRAHV